MQNPDLHSTDDDPILNAVETAALLKIETKTLMWLNKTGRGPKRRKVGREVRWLRSDVLDWFKSLPVRE